MVPDSILLQLREHYKAVLVKNMVMLEELERVINELNKNDIQVIVLKGAYLAEQVYKNIACRPMEDLDILIQKRQLGEAKIILNKLGYLEDPVIGNPKHDIFLKKDCIHQHIKLEVHKDIVSQQLILPLDLEDVWSKSNDNAMHLTHLINYLSYHFAMHRFDRIIWLFDIAILCNHFQNQIDWEEVYYKAIDWKLELVLLFTMSVIKNLLPDIKKIITFDKLLNDSWKLNHSTILFCTLQQKLLSGQNIKSIKHLLRIFLMQDIKENLKYSLRKADVLDA